MAQWNIPLRPDWLDLVHEPALEPNLPIVDTHHHLFDRASRMYMVDEFMQDINKGGHRIVATVYVDANLSYFTTGPEVLRPVGETVRVVKETQSRVPGSPKFGLGIVGKTDFRLGNTVKEVLEAHLAAGAGRFKGIRQIAMWDADDSLTETSVESVQGLLGSDSFRKGFRFLGELGLSYDTFVYSPQLPEVTDLANAFPDTTIVLNHCGCPLAQGVYAPRRDETMREWRKAIAELARRPNVYCKLGGVAKWLTGSELHFAALPPTSEQLEAAWRPYFEPCIEAFGAARCMFESNFPVEKSTCSFGNFWNACKRISAKLSPSERADLFSGTAIRAYKLDLKL